MQGAIQVLCFTLNLWISFNGKRTIYAATRHKRILVYLEPRERVRWLRMSFNLLEEANSAPQIHWREREKKREEIEGKDEKTGTEGMGEKMPPHRNKFPVTV